MWPWRQHKVRLGGGRGVETGCKEFCVDWSIGFRVQFMVACEVVIGGTVKDGAGHRLVCLGGVLPACQQPPLGLGQRQLTPAAWR